MVQVLLEAYHDGEDAVRGLFFISLFLLYFPINIFYLWENLQFLSYAPQKKDIVFPSNVMNDLVLVRVLTNKNWVLGCSAFL